MATERASDPTCTCPSGDGSLRWPCPKHPPAAAPAEMSPEFTDTARAAIAWVLWHHQGASSPVGQPLRFALGMGAHEPLPDWRIAEAKRYAEWAGATTAKFHEARASTPAAPGIDMEAVRELLARRLWQWRTHIPTNPDAPSTRAILTYDPKCQGQGETDYNNDVGIWREACSVLDEALALIDASPKGALNEQFGGAEGLGSPAGMEGHYRQALERIASQGPHYGPDGTRETWQHWCEIARDALADSPKGGSEAPQNGEVLVTVSGLTGSGKSAVAGEIEILCKALGLEVEWTNGDEEKYLTHADWTEALELYKPRVRIVEVNIPRVQAGDAEVQP